jgi:hypothetical protein
MSIQARLECNSVTDFGNYRIVVLNPVYSSDPESPNYSYSKATPSGELKLTITNPKAFSQIVSGRFSIWRSQSTSNPRRRNRHYFVAFRNATSLGDCRISSR